MILADWLSMKDEHMLGRCYWRAFFRVGTSFQNMYFFGRRDNLDKTAIRFHFGEAFDNIDGSLLYVDGDIAESWIDKDKLSFSEIKGDLAITLVPPVY
jgi:hypothetical protein